MANKEEPRESGGKLKKFTGIRADVSSAAAGGTAREKKWWAAGACPGIHM
jgi:hypothetical protein